MRELRILKKAGVQPIGRTEKLYSRFALQKVFEIELSSPCASKQSGTGGIIKATFENADTGTYSAVFAPLSSQILDRLEL